MLITTVLVFALQDPPTPITAAPAQSTEAVRPAAEAPSQRVAWYTSLEQAVTDATRLNRPILLQSAAPQCSGVPGMW
jgi:hypothetical protein